MGNLLEIVTALHKSTSRNYIERMCDNKIECMKKAKKYDFDYWDGDRRYGYGGYKYIPGRWKAVAEKLIAKYSLTNNSSILDIGCGKGFLLYEIKLILPRINLAGIDISAYAINNCKEEVKENVFYHDIKNSLSFNDKNFDLVLSLNCFHNLKIFDLSTALKEMQRVGKSGYLLVESFRNEAELFNLECWALTCQSFYSPEEWLWIFEKNGYSGDYEFIYFE